MYTGCVNRSIMIGPFDTTPCTGSAAQTSCVTGFIYYDHNVTLTNFECWPSWTGGNWEAWRETPRGSSSIDSLAINIAIPIAAVCVAGVIMWLRCHHRERKARHVSLAGQSQAEDMVPNTVPHKAVSVAENVEMSDEKDTRELEDQRRASELSTVMMKHGCVNCRLQTLEEPADDVSSYHTSASRMGRAELEATELPHPGETMPRSGPALYRMLQRFQM